MHILAVSFSILLRNSVNVFGESPLRCKTAIGSFCTTLKLFVQEGICKHSCHYISGNSVSTLKESLRVPIFASLTWQIIGKPPERTPMFLSQVHQLLKTQNEIRNISYDPRGNMVLLLFICKDNNHEYIYQESRYIYIYIVATEHHRQ